MFEIIPIKAQFAEGDRLSFNIIDAKNTNLSFSLLRENHVIWHGAKRVDHQNQISFHSLHLPGNSGYLLRAVDREGYTAETAFDISTNQIRYGFLADFSKERAEDLAPAQWLNRLHINYVQFYDWAYRHDQFIGSSAEYTDEMGKTISQTTLQHLIKACHERGMNAMAYGAIYGSSNSYALKHTDQCLYDKTGTPIPFFKLLSIMNVDRNCKWHDHILAEYQKALNLGFDGIHMDTYGSPTEGYDDQGCKLDLARDFRQLVDDANVSLHTRSGAPKLIFNNVNNWPTDYLATAHQTGLYIEVWDPYSTYDDILKLIDHARSISNLPVILAAYLPQFSKGGSEEAYNALFILTALITVAGATHLINGQEHGLLTQAYYSKYFTVDQKHSQKIITYYDYITYLSGLWSNREFRTAYLDTARSGGRTLIAHNSQLSDKPEPGRLWIQTRIRNDLMFINFINLTGSDDPKWTHTQKVHQTKPFELNVRTDSPVQSITYSTPDDPKGIKIESLSFHMKRRGNALYASIEVPAINIWGTVLIRL